VRLGFNINIAFQQMQQTETATTIL